MTDNKTDVTGAVKAMAAIVAITFVAEVIVMYALRAFGLTQDTLGTILLDAFLLSLVIAPAIYWLVLLPLRREHNRRQQAEELAEDMGKLAVTDQLTRVMNRRGITVTVIDAMAQAERYDTPLTICLADIDHFKRVNDSHGHEAGDRVLVGVAEIMADALRMPDKLGRYGGEEFLMVLPHTTIAQGRKIAERIRANVKRSALLGVDKTTITVSIGITQYRKGEDLERLISRVDQVLYDAKEGGRDRVAVHSDG